MITATDSALKWQTTQTQQTVRHCWLSGTHWICNAVNIQRQQQHAIWTKIRSWRSSEYRTTQTQITCFFFVRPCILSYSILQLFTTLTNTKKKHVHVQLSQCKTCTCTTGTTQNMYTYNCHKTEHVHVPLVQHKTCTRIPLGTININAYLQDTGLLGCFAVETSNFAVATLLV